MPRLQLPPLSRLPIRGALLSVRDLLATGGPFILLAIGLVVAAYWLLDPNPPRQVTLATGADQGAYAEFGRRYRTALARYGIDVVLRPTQGSGENLELLQKEHDPVDLAFVQGGADRIGEANDDEGAKLVSLGSLFYEPVWLFYREAAARQKLGGKPLESLMQLKGWKVGIGAEGSGVTNLSYRLLEMNGMSPNDIVGQRQGQTQAVVSLVTGESDAIVLTSAPEAPLVQLLLVTPGIRLMSWAQAEAYSRRLPMLVPVTLPRGVVQLAQNNPPEDVELLAPMAMLAARADTHPALQQLFVQVANEIHSEAGWFQRRGEFPNRRASDLPMSKVADRFYENGPPFLQRYLPFWLANLIDRMWVVIASLIVVLLPLSRVLPPLYELRIRSRVFRWYARLRQIEAGLAPAEPGAAASATPEQAQALLEELDDLDARVKRLSVPLAYTDELYALRSHIDLVRTKLRGSTPAPAA
ncbi:MAG TPA: TAXI family TRAP transporter solute-binding subunit [Methylibium sp.]|uniref:TAXI family TRAP transporter solute-binding subunit n=1 Tax=Methylibium sp. TaxID=2067992 RepID=UPI002DBDC0A4|nr:TAXI family TRAP transporter solute-binding subunit [Methylibium sp.]HEU4457728.1 TAXI family TRAP transporter solute-binding subunit [Methylibium sp.]